MLKNKKILLLILVLILLLIPNMVKAADTYTATTDINGVTVNWEYELNENGQIINLKCTNTQVLSGSFSIPSTIDDKTVVTLGYEAFKNATGITEVKIPKTIKDGPMPGGNPVFVGCTNLTNIILEDGLTVVPSGICASTKITEITLPKTVKHIEMNVFENCTLLNKVDLGEVEKIDLGAFAGCTSLNSITIPSSLKKGPLPSANPVFAGCTSLTNITLEDGLTVVPSGVCTSTKITEITVPATVTEIENSAFAECLNLTKINILSKNIEFDYYVSEIDTDIIFKNHNDDLTIYCYEDSKAAEYAKKHNIKYQYLKTEEKIDTTKYVSFPWMIIGGKGDAGDLEVKSWEYNGTYNMYYQFVEVPLEVVNKVNDLTEKYNNNEITYEEYFVQYNAAITKYNDNNWIETKDGSFEIDLSKFTGLKRFALWVKLVMEDKTVYEAQIYTMNGNELETNESLKDEDLDEIDKPDKPVNKDNTTASGNLPYTGGTFAIIVGIIVIVGVGIYTYKRNKDLKGI